MVRAHLKALGVEEVANVLTHGLGLVLSIAGFIFLVVLAFWNADVWHITSCIVYGLSLVTLYGASTAYHSAIAPHRKNFLRMMDHCGIYFLIAGSYTPFLLLVLRDGIGFGMLAVVWAIAIFGITMSLIFRERVKNLGIVLYLALGWLGVIAIQPMYAALGLTPMLLIGAGGISYTAGMIFFGWKRIRHHHAIFHIFVLVGSVLHYIAIAGYIVPRT
jgi:hemolysin III